MSHHETFPVSPKWQEQAYVNKEKYLKLYKDSLAHPEEFWAEQAKRIDWYQTWDKVKNTSFKKPITIEWYKNAKLNIAYNCIDRHLKTKAKDVAIIWEPDNQQDETLHITYQQLHDSVARWANALKANGVKKGDRVTIYLPMIPEAAYSMLACARIGAIHSIVFAGFSPEALADRINSCESEFLITADESVRGGRTFPLKDHADKARELSPHLKTTFVVQRTGAKVNWNDKTDVWYHDAIKDCVPQCEPEVMDAEDPLFILYTSGSTNKPKGILHTTGGYIVFAALTHEVVFDYKPGQIYWCAADIGWVTGHSYIVYGPLANGATTLMFEGVPTLPDCSRIWQIVDKHQVNILYTAPTLIRALMQKGDDPVKSTSRKSLELLGSVGEPINPEAWLWYYNVVGEGRCPIVDTWWQTETGGILISPLPGVTDLKPGAAATPFFGIQPELIDGEGKVIEGEGRGNLCIADSWPGQMRGIYKAPERFYETYFSQYEGKYFAGDGCLRDKDGDYWITGRVDDVLNVSGHRMGTAEIESALVEHKAVSEAAVVGYPHTIKGQGIYAYVTLVDGAEKTGKLNMELVDIVKGNIGAFAKPDLIHFTPALPKTRSGKIMRRILRKIAENDFENLGDTSTLADPGVLKHLIEDRMNR